MYCIFFSFSLINVCVWEPYIIFEGVNAGAESGGVVGVSGLGAGDADRADESDGADGAGAMPIKPFGLGGGGGLGCAVVRWNGSRNLPDDGGENGGSVGGPNGVRGG